MTEFAESESIVDESGDVVFWTAQHDCNVIDLRYEGHVVVIDVQYLDGTKDTLRFEKKWVAVL